MKFMYLCCIKRKPNMRALKINIKPTYRESIATLLLLLFVGFFVSISFFKHKHVIDGVLIVHSHPFSSTEHHTHSTDTASLIQQLSHFESKSAAFASLALASFIFIRFVTAATASQQLLLGSRLRHFSRPPPTPFI